MGRLCSGPVDTRQSMEAGTVSDKVTISYRGAKYELGRGKRYYGIWVTGAPASDPIDRWPLTNEGWTQAWARFTAMETPGTIGKVEKPRAGFRLPRMKRPGNPGSGGEFASGVAAVRNKPSRAVYSAGLLGLGLLLGLIGLFPGYVGSPSLASQADQLVPHLLYLAAWAVSCGLIAFGGRRPEIVRLGALLGAGLSAVTFGLFFADLGQVITDGSAALGTGLVLSLLGWLACTTGAVLALTVRSHAATASAPLPVTPPPAEAPAPAGAQSTEPPVAGPPLMGPHPQHLAGPSFAVPPQGSRGRPGGSRPAKPRLGDAGPLALVLLAAIGAVAAFAPSWDSFTLTATVPGTSQTITAGNAFANPGVIIAGNVAVMIAVIAVAALAALWRPVRHGAMLLTGATVVLIGQAISAPIQVTEPATPAQFGISQATAAANGLSISSGLTPIFWVYCVFVISLVVSIAWMLTAPHYPAMPTAPVSTPPAPTDPRQGVDSESDDSDDDDAEDDAESTYA
jgi:ABC-type transport system involved in multi-copper enzyme maturation permease subunit